MKSKSTKAALMGLTLLVGAPSVLAADYDQHWAKEAIDKWSGYKVIEGYGNEIFKPNHPVTRAELAAILTRVFNLQETTGAATYIDVFINQDKWYVDAVNKVSALGLMHIEGVFFEPDQPTTREEAAYAIAKAYQLSSQSESEMNFTDVERISEWSKEAINVLTSHQYLKGNPDGTFRPQDTLTRAELVTMLDNITNELITKPGVYNQSIKGNVVVNTSGVTLKDMTIEGDLYLAQGISDAKMQLENVTVKGTVYINAGQVVMSGQYDKVELASGRTLELVSGKINELIVQKTGSALTIGNGAQVETLTQNQPLELAGQGQVGGQNVSALKEVRLVSAGIYVNGEYKELPLEGNHIVLDVPLLSSQFNRSDVLEGMVIETSIEGTTLSSDYGSMTEGQKYTMRQIEDQLGLIREVALAVGVSPTMVIEEVLGSGPLTFGSLLDNYARAQAIAVQEGITLEDEYTFTRYMSHPSSNTSTFGITLRLQ